MMSSQNKGSDRLQGVPVSTVQPSLAQPVPASLPDDSASGNDSFAFWKLDERWREAAEERARSAKEAEQYLFEKYLPDPMRRPPRNMGAYYAVKRLIPQSFRHRMHSLAVRFRAPMAFPGWPYETSLLAARGAWLDRTLARLGFDDGYHIGFWPKPYQCCIVLTHDVEGSIGLGLMNKMAEVEEKYGFRSAWNLPLQQFKLDWRLIERLRAQGFEFGAHGLAHDGRLFRTMEDFSMLGPELERLAREHDLRGFRAPSTLRRKDWLSTLDFDFDSTFADTDPWEPQPGGTCSLFPFFIGRMIELPYTLPQDHTLTNLLHCDMLPVWQEKASWIASLGGMILCLAHPDYTGAPAPLRRYEEFLKSLKDIEGAWHALPSQVAGWWRQRTAMRLEADGENMRITGVGAERAEVRRLSEERLVDACRRGLPTPANWDPRRLMWADRTSKLNAPDWNISVPGAPQRSG